MKGFFLTPGLRRIPDRVAKECCSTCAGQMSTLVTTKNTATSTENGQDNNKCTGTPNKSAPSASTMYLAL